MTVPLLSYAVFGILTKHVTSDSFAMSSFEISDVSVILKAPSLAVLSFLASKSGALLNLQVACVKASLENLIKFLLTRA